MKGIWLQPPDGDACPCDPTCSLSDFFQMVNDLCMGKPEQLCAVPVQAVCLAAVQLSSSLQLLAGFPPYCVWMEAALRARDPINQLLPQLTFPALKGIVLKRLGDVLSQLDCVFKLASFTWERKTLTNVEQTQSQCSQQEGDPSSFSSSPQEVTAVAAVSVALHGKAARYCAPFRYGQ